MEELEGKGKVSFSGSWLLSSGGKVFQVFTLENWRFVGGNEESFI
jgi:hypothetical protein